MDVDGRTKDEGEDRGRERDRSPDRDRRRSRSRDRRDRMRSRSRDRRGGRRNDHWEPESRRGGARRGGRRGRSRSRSRSRSRHRSRSPRSLRRRRRSRSWSSRSRSRSRSRGGRGRRSDAPRSLGGPMNATAEEANEFSKISKRENRVYVGNLSYDVRYRDLTEFLRGAGEVLFAEVLTTASGSSKGCGIVEFASPEDARRAIKELSEQSLLGRQVFIREDRETEARFGTALVGARGASGVPSAPTETAGNQLYVGNLPYQAGWQDLKDLFRQAGSIVRADINFGLDGRPKGSGTVVFESTKDAQNAIQMYHGYDWYGRALEVREDRYAGLSGSRGRGGGRGGRGRGRGGMRGGYSGDSHHGGGYGEGRSFNQNLYDDYTGPDQNAGSNVGMDGAPYGGYNEAGGASFARQDAEPSSQIMVRNLPWSTANEDLVDLFETTGQVDLAEILFDGTRSKGMGVVQFAQVAEAETAIAKFQGYMYGGRPLDVRYNDRWHTFAPSAAKGNTAMPADQAM